MGVRFFSGSRDKLNKRSIAQEILRLEVEKKGKLDPQDRFKFIMQRKMEESRKKVEMAKQAKGNGRPMSQKAEKALKDIAAKKASKEQKRLRRMVIVQPRNFSNGRLNKKGGIYDIAGNKVGQVNTKDGKISTYLGTHLGQYKPKSHYTNSLIQNSIDQWSPYFINLRKMQAMQAAGLDPMTGQPLNPTNSNVYGATGGDSNSPYGGGAKAAMLGGNYTPSGQLYNRAEPTDKEIHPYGEQSPYAGQQAIAGSVHGSVSNNVWGNFADNAWGTSFDNVHGTASSDVWGGVGGTPYGSLGKAVQLWGTGNGTNHLKALINRLSQLFGLNTKSTRKQIAGMRGESRTARSGPTLRSSGGAPQRTAGSAPAPRAPVTTGRR